MHAWTDPFIGALIRPFRISDRLGGAWRCLFVKKSYVSATPEGYFTPFLILFLILFTATGIGNGSSFRTIANVFDEEQAGPVLGWTSAVAACGAFIIAQVFGEQIKGGTPQ
jgi:NNP family nitrate/nitrite transporter-like MFS transporter